SAIWGLDFMFTVAQQGGAGVNFHCNDAHFTPISFLKGPATPNPLYYGMLFFSKASLGKMLTVGSTAGGVNFTSYAVRQSDGTVQVTLINKDLSKDASVSLSTANGKQLKNASVLRLQAPTPDALTGTLFGGSAVKADGTWAPSVKESLAMSGNTTTVKVPACSAVLITLK
ncbi:MAG TPA: glycosyl hydrolase family 79 C-terminal domain-containing protein, partial [Puia sp.]